MAGLRSILPDLDGIILNRDELSVLMETPISTAEDIKKSCAELRSAGLSSIIVTQGGEDVYFSDRQAFASRSLKIHKVQIEKRKISRDVTGAGDAFSAGVLFGLYHDLTLSESVRYGIAAAQLTLQVDETVNPALSRSSLISSLNREFYEHDDLLRECEKV
jgi:pseudouridine kinase